ncbi:MAG: hypothetical protein GKR93_11120 [Gammaproteobacteria bacterium]|nr:hypothetical protein [Gammaproteobacteria bacterium]
MQNEGGLRLVEPLRKQSILGSWISRITSKNAHEQAMVHPCIIGGKQTLVYERGLQEKDPLAFEQIVEFSEQNGFTIKEDQRSDFLDGVKRVKNKRHANVITIMALTSTLLSSAVAADSPLDNEPHKESHEVDHNFTDAALDFDFDAELSEKELVSGLLGWINAHSSFQHNLDKFPDIVKVSPVDMAHVAFGDELPAAIDPEKLQIYGLYNFNEEAVYILDSLDLDSEKGRGVLLHELVHFLQYQYDQDDHVQCKNELEALAYILEAQYLQSQKHEHKISMKHIEKVSQCS